MTIWHKQQYRQSMTPLPPDPPGDPNTALLCHFENALSNAFGAGVTPTNLGTPVYFTGKFGQGKDTGNSQGFTWTRTQTTSLISANPNSFDWWLYNATSSSKNILQISSVGDTSKLIVEAVGGSGNIRVILDGTVIGTSVAGIQQGTFFQHIALMFSWDGSTLRLYIWVDGAAKPTIAMSGQTSATWDAIWNRFEQYFTSGGILIDEYRWLSAGAIAYIPEQSFPPKTVPYLP